MRLWTIAFVVFLLNLPFGYWRQNVRKFSFQWFLAVHLPVRFVLCLDDFSNTLTFRGGLPLHRYEHPPHFYPRKKVIHLVAKILKLPNFLLTLLTLFE